jgi:MerR family regulatory protein
VSDIGSVADGNHLIEAFMNEALTIAEVAERSGVAASALRFHEEQRLIEAERTNAGTVGTREP